MKILVSNIGSTSFKFRLFDIGERSHQQLAAGGAERIGSAGGSLSMQTGQGQPHRQTRDFADHGQAIVYLLDRLADDGVLEDKSQIDAIAFKTVMGGDLPPVVLVDDKVLGQMEYFIPVAPAHNPPYISAMRMFAKVLPAVPLVACFEPGFHADNPPRRRHYAVPREWFERGVKRYGFHGASHRYIAARIAELTPSARRIISCHLGGSSSLCAIRDGKSLATSMGLTPQSGPPQGSRVGDLDVFAIKLMMDKTGRGFEELLGELGKAGGLAGLSGIGADMRDIRQAAQAGNERAKLAIDVFTTAVRDYLGAYLVELGGADAIVFTGGIGENNPWMRQMILAGLEFAGIVMDEAKNSSARDESRFDAQTSKTALWVMPTNEELIVASLAAELLASQAGGD